MDYDEEADDDDEGVHSPGTSSVGGFGQRFTYRVTTNSNGNIEFAADQNDFGKCVKIVNSSDEASANFL